MINKTKRDVKDSAEELKEKINKGKGIPDFKTELIAGANKKGSKPYGVRVYEIISKKIKDRCNKLFSKIKRNGKDLSDGFSTLCEGLCVELLYGRPIETKQFKSEAHFVQWYDGVNELHILTRDGCKAYGIKLPEPEKEVKAPPKEKKTPVPTKQDKNAKKGDKKPVLTPKALKELLAKNKANKAKKK